VSKNIYYNFATNGWRKKARTKGKQAFSFVPVITKQLFAKLKQL